MPDFPDAVNLLKILFVFSKNILKIQIAGETNKQKPTLPFCVLTLAGI